MNQSDISTPKPSILLRCFFGALGLRAGWRLLIFVTIFVALFMATCSVACFLFPVLRSQGTSPPLVICQEGLAFVCLLLASSIMARIERRKVSDYGLPWRRMFCSQFWQGTAVGFISLSLLLCIMQTFGVFCFEKVGLHGADIWIYGGSYALAFVLVASFEEFLNFGYALFTLFTGIGFWNAAILSSALFAILHAPTPGETWLGVLNAGLTGLLSCLLIRRTGNLWTAVGYHAAWDWGQSYLYGVPNSGRVIEGHLFSSSISGPAWLSGGSVGPEGSVFCTALLVILWFVICWLFQKTNFPVVHHSPEPLGTTLDSVAIIPPPAPPPSPPARPA